MSADDTERNSNFIEEIVEEDLRSGKHETVVTRFPPEPNGYLHIGHAKSICLNFGLAEKHGGRCNLRFDDTNPAKENVEYVDSIKADVRWLGFDWGERELYASDYFAQLHEWAVELIRKGLAYVDSLPLDELRAMRGTVTEPGRPSPYQERSVEENLDLFARMTAGEFPDGAHVLRAKIDMAHPNMLMRDPVMYRIVHAEHHRTGDAWTVYPMYDWAHGQSDSIEGVTHSVCTLEFEVHRELYDWFLDALDVYHPRQYEFARLNLTYTMMSKRRLLELVETGVVDGWDDPRMPTLRGLRRRGYPPEAIRAFCERIGVNKYNSTVDVRLLEHCVRERLNAVADRVMVVTDPVKVVITDYPEGKVEELDADNNPEDPSAGTRKVSFSRELWIERGDYMDDPPRKWFRLGPGREVRLKHAYLVTCEEVVRDDAGEIVEIRCTHDPDSRGGSAPDGRKVKGTLHWVSAATAVDAEVRDYEHLFTAEDPSDVPEDADWKDALDPDSRVVRAGCKAEASLADVEPGTRFQFMRLGYYCADPDGVPGRPVFNRTVSLKDSWSKQAKQGGGKKNG